MITRQKQKARINTRAGFTLLELLIVLFLLSMGYASLYSAGLGSSDDGDTYQQTIEESREIILYGRKLALAKGQAVMVRISNKKIQLLNQDGSTAVPSPTEQSGAYEVISAYAYSRSTLKLYDDTDVTDFYFDSQGRLASRASTADELVPLILPLTLGLQDDAGTNTGFILLSNVTGELIPV